LFYIEFNQFISVVYAFATIRGELKIVIKLSCRTGEPDAEPVAVYDFITERPLPLVAKSFLLPAQAIFRH